MLIQEIETYIDESSKRVKKGNDEVKKLSERIRVIIKNLNKVL